MDFMVGVVAGVVGAIVGMRVGGLVYPRRWGVPAAIVSYLATVAVILGGFWLARGVI